MTNQEAQEILNVIKQREEVWTNIRNNLQNIVEPSAITRENLNKTYEMQGVIHEVWVRVRDYMGDYLIREDD